MKNVCAFLVVVVTASGCGVELLTTTAIQSELQAEQMKAIKGQVNNAADKSARVNIQHAIDTYYAENGQYPATLEVLVPTYLPSLPTGPNGQAYPYDPTQGKLLDNAAPATPAAPTGSGAGVMGEVTTGIGIQNQLNSMGQSGVNTAQSRSREHIGNMTEQHNRQQEKALKDLGM